MVSPSTFVALQGTRCVPRPSPGQTWEKAQKIKRLGAKRDQSTCGECGVCSEKCGVTRFQAERGKRGFSSFLELPEPPVEGLADLLKVPVIFLREVLALRPERNPV